MTFSHVLSVIRCLLIVPFPESSLNDEAGKLFMESYEEYARRAKLMAGVHGRPRPFSAYGDDGVDEEVGESRDGKSKENMHDDVGNGNQLPGPGKSKRASSSSRLTSSSSLPQHPNRASSLSSIKSNNLTRNSSVGSSSNRGLRVGGNRASSVSDKKSKMKKGLKRL